MTKYSGPSKFLTSFYSKHNETMKTANLSLVTETIISNPTLCYYDLDTSISVARIMVGLLDNTDIDRYQKYEIFFFIKSVLDFVIAQAKEVTAGTQYKNILEFTNIINYMIDQGCDDDTAMNGRLSSSLVVLDNLLLHLRILSEE